MPPTTVMIADPRPDLSARFADGPLWRELFRRATDEGLRAELIACRNQGTRLIYNRDGFRFLPVVGPGCWNSEAEYPAWRDEHLRPHREDLNQLLTSLRLPATPDWQQADTHGGPRVQVTAEPPPDYGHVLVTSPEDIQRAAAAARIAGVCGVDTETARRPGLDGLSSSWTEQAALDPHLGRVRLLQIGTPGQPAVLIDLAPWWDDPQRLAGVLAPVLELMADPRTVKAVQHSKFDLKMIRGTLGGQRFEVASLFDTEVAGQLLACGLWPSDGFNLRALVQRHLGWSMDKSEQTSDWSGTLTESQLRYAGIDVGVLPPLRDVQITALDQQGLISAADLEFGCIPAISDMEYAGIGLDMGVWGALGDKVRAQWAAARARVLAAFGDVVAPQVTVEQPTFFGDNVRRQTGFNPDSPDQVLSALRALDAKIEDTQDETLQALIRQGGRLGEAAAAMSEYRGYAKALSSYLDPMPDFVHPLSRRIHPDYKQLNRKGVGRLSAVDPAVQQWPRSKDYRRAVVSREGQVLCIADYSAVEIRNMAWLSGDPVMTQALLQGLDIHRLTASLILGKRPEDVTKEERQMAKAVNFGLIYGQSGPGLQAYAATAYSVLMSLNQANQFRQRYFQAYKGVAAYHKQQDSLARAAREVRTASGRSRRWMTNQMPATELYNTPDQGTGADILKRAMARLRPHVMRMGAELVANIHDELLIEVAADKAEEMREVQRREMIAAGDEFLAPVPVEVEAEIGRSWADKG